MSHIALLCFNIVRIARNNNTTSPRFGVFFWCVGCSCFAFLSNRRLWGALASLLLQLAVWVGLLLCFDCLSLSTRGGCRFLDFVCQSFEWCVEGEVFYLYIGSDIYF